MWVFCLNYKNRKSLIRFINDNITKIFLFVVQLHIVIVSQSDLINLTKINHLSHHYENGLDNFGFYKYNSTSNKCRVITFSLCNIVINNNFRDILND